MIANLHLQTRVRNKEMRCPNTSRSDQFIKDQKLVCCAGFECPPYLVKASSDGFSFIHKLFLKFIGLGVMMTTNTLSVVTRIFKIIDFVATVIFGKAIS